MVQLNTDCSSRGPGFQDDSSSSTVYNSSSGDHIISSVLHRHCTYITLKYIQENHLYTINHFFFLLIKKLIKALLLRKTSYQAKRCKTRKSFTIKNDPSKKIFCTLVRQTDIKFPIKINKKNLCVKGQARSNRTKYYSCLQEKTMWCSYKETQKTNHLMQTRLR